ncbi:hypothetical protein [Streptomyces sp. NBC_00096]|uniref:hypothetical protein n=1 Tax=Streptomyces sp. NBC_00096 TaxID=2975650 RepID=UPI0032432CB6
MSTGRWIWAALWRYVVTAFVGVGAVVAVVAAAESGVRVRILDFELALRVLAVAVPLLTVATMAVILPLAGRRFEPPTGGPLRIRGGWMVVLPLVPALPMLLFVPHLYLILLAAQLGYVILVLPRQDSRATAELLRLLADPEVPAGQRAGIAQAVGTMRTRPVVESLMGAAVDRDLEVADAARESLYGIWRRNGVVGEDLVLRLPEEGRERIQALGVRVRIPW